MTPLDDRNWQPATFRERGAAVGFTSPLLAGARLRHAERRCELVVPHPGGARGVYIFALGALAEFCVASLHDQRLAEHLAGLPAICPASVREAGRAVAARGFAGRGATAAAGRAASQEAHAAAQAETALLRALLDQNNQNSGGNQNSRGGQNSGGGQGGGATPDRQATETVLTLARRTGRDADAVRADIARLSQTLARAGLDIPGGHGQPGRASHLLAAIEAMRTSIVDWGGAGVLDGPGSTLIQAAGCMHAAGQRLLAATHATLSDRTALLKAWASNPDGVTAHMNRADWLLDGWENLTLLWQVAETHEQRAEAIGEAVGLLPPMPPEAELWLGETGEALAMLRPRRPPAGAGRLAPRPPSQSVSLVARNEQIRARAA